VGAEAEALEQPRQHHQRGHADDHVHDVGDGAGAEDLLDQFPVEEADEAGGWVRSSPDDHGREPYGLEALDQIHRFLLERATGFV
jgi:hypothetical protein